MPKNPKHAASTKKKGERKVPLFSERHEAPGNNEKKNEQGFSKP